ncbi:hypothetical protein FAIPA1_60040 [Frankia sp. AiPs1]|uniref:hypothetical protein n=1 Tax=Frankia sp. AiPa1 TaxID=573492 RepID=UPI00202B1C18|nr:hypothetical protein [Frankia sp. AiPa1]MCL9762691.1 hypothetical protein [Frankia sp. AiPa1]
MLSSVVRQDPVGGDVVEVPAGDELGGVEQAEIAEERVKRDRGVAQELERPGEPLLPDLPRS